MTCPNCKTEAITIRSRIVQGKISTGCDNCLTDNSNVDASGIAKYKRDRQKEDYRRDITQPNDKAFAKAYPERFREMHGDDLYRKLA